MMESKDRGAASNDFEKFRHLARFYTGCLKPQIVNRPVTSLLETAGGSEACLRAFTLALSLFK